MPGVDVLEYQFDDRSGENHGQDDKFKLMWVQ